MTALGGCHAEEEVARRYVVAVTEEGFPSRFPSGVVLGGPWGFPNYRATGPLTDQGGLLPGYYADPELQQARVERRRACSAPRPLAECSTLQREGHPRAVEAVYTSSWRATTTK